MKPLRDLSLATAMVLLFALQGCSCGDDPTKDLSSMFSSSLQRDESGKADYLVDFGEVSLGARGTSRVEIKNEGSSPLLIQGLQLERPFSHDLPSTGLSVPVGGSAPLTFMFSPSEETEAPLERIAALSTNEGSGKEHTVRIIGRGRRPLLRCEPSFLAFDDVPRGTTRTLTTVCTNELSFTLEVEVAPVSGEHDRFFSTAIQGAVDGWATVDGSGSLIVEVKVSAEAIGPLEASFELRDRSNQDLASLAATAHVIESNLLVEPSSCLDFSYVGVGLSAQRALQVRTIGVNPLYITALEIPETERSSFTPLSEPPMELQPGEEATDLWVEFHPTSAGRHQSQLAIHTNDPSTGPRVVTACVKGFGGGPSIHCSREAIDFGMVAIGIPMRRTYTCVNDGSSALGERIDPLFIEGIRSTNEVFAARVLGGGPAPAGYQIGDSFTVEVVYAPVEERFDLGKILIDTASTPGGSVETSISGQGRDLPPCEFRLEPPQLRFGIVDIGQEKTLDFAITNLLETSCLISDLRLSDDSHSAYSLEAIESLELEGHERLNIEVHFAPTKYQEELALGRVEFQISDPLHSQQEIPLHAAAAKPCLVVEPAVVDFGAVEPGCFSSQRWVSVTNTCLSPVKVTSVDLGDSANLDSFQIQQRPAVPKTLHVHERVELSLNFAPPPGQYGDHRGSIFVEVEGSGPYVARLLGVAEESPMQTDAFEQEGRPKVDILWVMDNSGSFASYQDRIATNLPSFIALADQQQIDYHIAVTTSGLTPHGACPGGADGGENGRFFPIDGSHPRILTPNTADLERHWAHNMRVGTCHTHEPHVEAAFRALSEPLISETKRSEHWSSNDYNDGNAGFLRREASLSIIFVADEVEQSIGFGRNLSDYLRFFRSLKGPNMLRIHAITGSKSSEHSSCGLNHADRFHYLIEETGGTWVDICTPKHDDLAWAEGMKSMSDGAFGFQTRFTLRGRPADINGDGFSDENDIQLHVNGSRLYPLTTGGTQQWSYYPSENVIDFEPLYIPRAGARVTATYQVSCLAPP